MTDVLWPIIDLEILDASGADKVHVLIANYKHYMCVCVCVCLIMVANL
jgi:hypothetical protein